MKVKEMIYGDRKEKEILAEGSWGPYQYKVVSLGSHPCGYVSIPDNHPLHGKLELMEAIIACHGGITFYDRMNDGMDSEWGTEFYIGWDYAHSGDFMGGGFGREEFDTKYTTEEIINECYLVIGQLTMYDDFASQFDFKDNQEFLKELIGD